MPSVSFALTVVSMRLTTTASTLLDKHAIAEALGLSVRTIDRLVADQEIPHYRIRGQLRFDLDEVRKAFAVGPTPGTEVAS